MDLFHTDRFENVKVSAKTGKPSVIQSNLIELLLASVEEVKRTTGFRIPLPTTVISDGGEETISLSRKLWEPFACRFITFSFFLLFLFYFFSLSIHFILLTSVF